MPDGVTIRRLFPGWRYVVIDCDMLSNPLVSWAIGVCATNGRIIWGRAEAEQFAVSYCERSGRRWRRENYR